MSLSPFALLRARTSNRANTTAEAAHVTGMKHAPTGSPATKRSRRTVRGVATILGTLMLLGLAPAGAFAAGMTDSAAGSVSVSAAGSVSESQSGSSSGSATGQPSRAGAGSEKGLGAGDEPTVIAAGLPTTILAADPDAGAAPGKDTAGSDSSWIPLNRWSDGVANIHSRPNAVDPVDSAAKALQTNNKNMALTGLTAVWTATSALSDFAANLQPINSVGIVVDRGASALGTVLISEPIIFVIAGIIAVVGAIWRKSRGGNGSPKMLFSVVASFIVLGIMTAGATASTANPDNTNYRPGIASPGWFVTKINSTVAAASDGALAGFNRIDFKTVAQPDGGVGGELSCQKYLGAIKSQFNDRKKGGTASVAAISSMWEPVGLEAYKSVQFGTSSKWVDKTWCHALEMNSGIGATQQREMMSQNATDGIELFKKLNPNSPAFTADNKLDRDKVLVGYAACTWDGSNFRVEPEWSKKLNGDGVAGDSWITDENCTKFFTGGADTVLDDLNFNIGTGEPLVKTINKLTDDKSITNWVQSWQGTNTGAAAGTTLVWAFVSSIVIFLILGVALSGMVLIAKCLAVIAMASVLLVIVFSLFTREGPGAKIADLLKKVVGYSLVSAGASFIVLIVTWMTQLMISLGSAVLTPGSVVALIWTGASPLVACAAIALVTKRFRIPNPLSVKGALAYGAAGGAAGSIVGSGIANRLANQGKSAALGGAKSAGNNLLNRASGGKLGSAPTGLGGKTREGAGLPGAAQGKGTGAVADKDELAAARAFTQGKGGPSAIPQSAGERANAMVKAGLVGAGAGAAATGRGVAAGVKGAPSTVKATVTGLREAPGAVRDAGVNIGTGIVTGEYAGRVADSAREGLGAVKENAVNVAATVQREARQGADAGRYLLDQMRSPEGRAGLRELATDRGRVAAGAVASGTATATKAAVVTSAKAINRASNGKVAEKARDFAKNPATATWQATRKTVKGAAIAGGLGAVTLATGGAALPVIAAVGAGSVVRKRREANAEQQRQEVQTYREHLERQKAEDAKKAREAQKSQKAAAAGTPAQSVAPAAPAAGPAVGQAPAGPSAGQNVPIAPSRAAPAATSPSAGLTAPTPGLAPSAPRGASLGQSKPPTRS
jgi:hypothetical protein